MIEPAELSLAEIRERLRAERRPTLLRRWADRLARDDRAGARQLGDACRRRREELDTERARLRRLFALRRRLRRGGLEFVAGVDEVGVGPLAGPVVAAAVVLPDRVDLPGLNDSKRLTRAARERLAEAIADQALAIGIGSAEPSEIDELNILRATLAAMCRAVRALRVAPDHVLVDARTIPEIEMPQTALVRGDAVDGSVAAASIVAKVHRDAIMRRLDRHHPGYGLAVHMGYPTADHMAALRERGASPIHRRSFAPVAAVVSP